MSERVEREEQSVERIVRRKLSDDVFDRLRDMIRTGSLSPGDPMPSERDLMERFGVGRPAVREALQSLETKGLITISHGERSRVKALTAEVAFEQMDEVAKLLLSSEPSNLESLKEVRRIFEAGVVSIAAQKCTKRDVRDLTQCVAAQREQLNNPQSFVQADIDFHARIARVTANPLIVAVSEAMLKWLFQYHTSILHWSGHEETTLREHEAIVRCLENADASASVQMMEKHLDRSEALYSHRA